MLQNAQLALLGLEHFGVARGWGDLLQRRTTNIASHQGTGFLKKNSPMLAAMELCRSACVRNIFLFWM